MRESTSSAETSTSIVVDPIPTPLWQRKPTEVQRLLALYQNARSTYAEDLNALNLMVTDPIGPLPADSNPSELAAWNLVGNILLN